jgi:hypothetical protein
MKIGVAGDSVGPNQDQKRRDVIGYIARTMSR